jgi:hypothetical protein
MPQGKAMAMAASIKSLEKFVPEQYASRNAVELLEAGAPGLLLCDARTEIELAGGG